MKKKNVQRALALALAATMLAGTVAGCGKSSDSDSTQGGKSSNGKYAKELTIDVFDSQANFQGEQTGWFAKLIHGFQDGRHKGIEPHSGHRTWHGGCDAEDEKQHQTDHHSGHAV